MSSHPHQCGVCNLIHLGPYGRPCDVPRLRAAFHGVELTEQEDRFLRWFAGCGLESVEQLVSLVARVREVARCDADEAWRAELDPVLARMTR